MNTTTSIADLGLRDIHPPGDAPFWPPAPGWWLLGALVLAGSVASARAVHRRRRSNRRRKAMLGELDRVGAAGTPEALAAGVSELLKRLALERFGSRAVAALTGTDWLRFLDRTGGNGRFADGPGRVLAEGPYAPSSTVDKPALLKLAGDWIRSNVR